MKQFPEYVVHGLIGGERETFRTSIRRLAMDMYKLWQHNPNVICCGWYVEGEFSNDN